MRQVVKQYIHNCYSCHRSKIFRNKYNDLLISAAVSIQRWIDIFMNFIIGLSDSKEHNVICIIIDKLFRKRYYKLCTTIDENISTEIIAEILIRKIFKYHDLFIFITSNKNSQFIIIVWKVFCCRLRIICKLSTT